ncbi:MAG: NPCBM/NEW2 domain-containing protein [Planctomycetes bacterium]|nr:NPCBM/NEW2 domain-containing protein [Planctomycetota bacterium]
MFLIPICLGRMTASGRILRSGSVALLLLLDVLWPRFAWCVSAQSSVLWIDGSPHVEIRLEGPFPENAGEMGFLVLLFNKDGNFLWQGGAKLVLGKEPMASGRVKLEKIVDPKAAHDVEISLHVPALGLDYWERIHFAAESAALQHYGVRRIGSFPNEKLLVPVRVNRVTHPIVRKVDLALTLRDADENVILKRVENVPVSDQGTEHVADITPAGLDSAGPLVLEASVENESLGLYLNWTDRAALSHKLSPVTSFETDDATTWYVCSAQPYYLQEWAGEVTKTFPPHIRSFSRYYSPDLYDDRPGTYPALLLDGQEKRSGRQSLRIEYAAGKPAHVFSSMTLPGFPLMARFWVKGNGTKDKLIVHWRDKTDLERPGWGRFISYTFYEVCTLSFEGWKCFRVPVLGEGLQFKTYSGNTQEMDVPVHLLGLSIHPEGGGEEKRSVWLDDVFVETQAGPRDRIALELRADTPDHQLHEKASLLVCAGSGSDHEMGRGRLQLTARDRRGQVVHEQQENVTIPPEGFQVFEFPLGAAWSKNPVGPVDVDVSFLDPSVPGTKKTARMTFKKADSYAVFWDFERNAAYSGYAGGLPAETVAGGAEGSAKALPLEVELKPKPPQGQPQQQPAAPAAGTPEPAHSKPIAQGVQSVLFHPALPGLVDRMDLWVRGGDKPLDLEAGLLDAGRTGVSNKDRNEFWLPKVTVDWQDWRRVEFSAPPVPEYYGDIGRWFFRKPWYPLNLVLRVTPRAEGVSLVWVDNIRVRTHLLPEEELRAEVAFPDDSHLHAPGTPLEVVLANFSSKPKALALAARLQSYQDRTEAEAKPQVTVPPGGRVVQRLVESLRPGIYTLDLDGLDGRSLRETIEVLDASRYFGPNPLEKLASMPDLRSTLSLMVEPIYLDWDNTEPVPGLFHYVWFESLAQQTSANGRYRLRPVVGFSADWAGPEAQDSVAKATYTRYMANHLQVPARLADWSAYVRQVLRNYRGRFAQWVFWENPDLKDAPQSIPPQKYPEMLRIFKQWVSLYDPGSKVIAGGFNMDKTLDYLEQIENPAALEFDEMAVRMNIGELSPEEADVESFLDELNRLLKIEETGRRVQVSELDWGIGEYVSPPQHAAYHARASLILNSRGADLHQFSFINVGQSFSGYGIFYRTEYGNSENIQTFKPTHVPKPAYFALVHIRKFLEEWKFVKSVQIADLDLQANRAFIYRNAAGDLAAAVWRVRPGARLYRIPASWKEASASDAFGFDVSLAHGIPCTALPTLVRLPASYSAEHLAFELRHMTPADGKDAVTLDLHLGEPDSCQRANYGATGSTETVRKMGKLPGGRKLNEAFVQGLLTEQFEFQLEQPGDLLLSRRWMLEGDGHKLFLRLNGGPETTWDLTPGKTGQPGLRESTFVLRRAAAGRNVLAIRYEKPGNCSGYRLEPMPAAGFIDLARWGVLQALQTKGEFQRYRSASGTPLTIGKTRYDNGVGTHAVALVEYPLDGQFSAFEVTGGLDSVNEGRGSAIFEIHVDGSERASSGLLNGFSRPVTLKVDKLENARRLFLVVKDAGDGNADDLADWVDGKLFLK